MESNESPEQNKKENAINLSSFSSDIFGFNPPRRIKSEPLPELKFLFDYFSDNKNTLKIQKVSNILALIYKIKIPTSCEQKR